MPIVNGQMYAEAEGLVRFDELNVLLLGGLSAELRTFAIQVDTLHAYITDTLGSNVRIRLHCSDAVAENVAQALRITRHSTGELTEANLSSVAKQLDIDVVLDQNGLLGKRYTQEHFYEFQVVATPSELASSCEDFLVGHSIVWLFANAAWNTPMFMRYFGRPGVSSDYFSFMGECRTTKGYSTDQQDRVRYISNRLGQIEYSKDIIQYHLKRMRKAERKGLPDTGNLELNYHLGNYYFLMAGVMDSMSRLINDIYKLGLTRHDLALEKKNFIQANRRKRTGFVRILTNKVFVDWLSFLKERRNFIAHDGDMRQSPLVEPNATPLTDEEVERLVDQKMDWNYASSILPPESVQAMRDQAAQMIRIERDYRVIAKNVMIVPDVRTGGTKIYQPLRSIEYDYEKLCDVMAKLLDKLKQ